MHYQDLSQSLSHKFLFLYPNSDVNSCTFQIFNVSESKTQEMLFPVSIKGTCEYMGTVQFVNPS